MPRWSVAGQPVASPRAGLPAAGSNVSLPPPLSPSAPSCGSANSGEVVHGAPSSGHCRLPPPPERATSQVGVYIAVLFATIVFTSVMPSPKIPPATTLSPVAWLFAIVQFIIVPVGELPSHTPPPLLPNATFSAIVTLVSWAWQVLIQMPPL